MASHFRFLTWLGLCLTTLPAADLKLADVEFFESRIRPVLVAECYECHDAKKQKGDLRLDYRDGLLKGGEEGPAIVPGDAKKSLLLQSINHTHETLQNYLTRSDPTVTLRLAPQTVPDQAIKTRCWRCLIDQTPVTII